MALLLYSHPRRPFMPQERLTANTFGIQQIRKELPLDPKSHTLTLISGKLLEPLWRGSPSTRPNGKIQAPDFNKIHRIKSLSGDVKKRYPNISQFEMGHAWGPGFGDEAFVGMMWVPKEVNQYLQNRGIEARIRELYEDTKYGSDVKINASVESWNEENMITEFAREIAYSVTVDGPGNHHEFYEINIETAAPGSPVVMDLKVTL
ncbi:hypothetical protein ACVI8K_006100 [Bradyrhizobium barranii subsp. barranii]